MLNSELWIVIFLLYGRMRSSPLRLLYGRMAIRPYHFSLFTFPPPNRWRPMAAPHPFFPPHPAPMAAPHP